MATFAKSKFNAVAYAASRPSYPPALYSHVLNYASKSPSSLPTSTKTNTRTLVDLGCGPGLSTFAFLPHFDKILGLDPSAAMVNAAEGLKVDEDIEGKDVRFEQGFGEDMKMVEDASVDLIVAGQAAHWFDAPAVYAEVQRVLKPGGSFAFWGYGEVFFPNNPSINPLISQYSAGTLGAYWQQPGRSIVEDLLRPFPPPTSSTSFLPSSLERTYFVPPSEYPSTPAPGESFEPLLLKHEWDMEGFEGYLRTWSSAFSYNEKHEGTDIVSEFVEVLKEALGKDGVKGSDKFLVAWRMAVLKGKKKEQ
ncbi:trans-aconitate 3-methyltransferase [Pseudohyphozyma bogoriensis]|nr:trans-aconitate 3-methyltransferase [Pseudohyphozyma bogoriensis]